MARVRSNTESVLLDVKGRRELVKQLSKDLGVDMTVAEQIYKEDVESTINPETGEYLTYKIGTISHENIEMLYKELITTTNKQLKKALSESKDINAKNLIDKKAIEKVVNAGKGKGADKVAIDITKTALKPVLEAVKKKVADNTATVIIATTTTLAPQIYHAVYNYLLNLFK